MAYAQTSGRPERGVAVRFVNVTKKFGAAAAVNELCLEVQQGEFLTLLGSSGCGKTTTLRLINGFESADSGSVFINERNVSRLPPYRRNVNTVFQNYALFPHMTIFDNVAYGLVVKRMPQADINRRVIEMLERVGLADKAKSLPRQLSGGQMQRAALVRALVNEPEVLLLDEPLGALDAKLRKSMQLELKSMHKRLGMTFVYVTHDQEEALVMSDRIAVMDRGAIMHLGTPEEIYRKPRTPFVADFIGKSNFLRGRVGSQQTVGRRSFVSEGGVEIAGLLPPTTMPGAPILVAFRSHSAKVSPSVGADATAATFTATLRDVIYAGPLLHLILELPGGQEILIEQPADGGRPELVNGDKLFVAINADEAMWFEGVSQ